MENIGKVSKKHQNMSKTQKPQFPVWITVNEKTIKVAREETNAQWQKLSISAKLSARVWLCLVMIFSGDKQESPNKVSAESVRVN